MLELIERNLNKILRTRSSETRIWYIGIRTCSTTSYWCWFCRCDSHIRKSWDAKSDRTCRFLPEWWKKGEFFPIFLFLKISYFVSNPLVRSISKIILIKERMLIGSTRSIHQIEAAFKVYVWNLSCRKEKIFAIRIKNFPWATMHKSQRKEKSTRVRFFVIKHLSVESFSFSYIQ